MVRKQRRRRKTARLLAGIELAGGLTASLRPWALIRFSKAEPQRELERPASFKVLVICPKLEDASSLPGAANCGVLRRLIDSTRKVRLFSPDTFQVRASDAFTFRIPSLRNTL